MASNGASQNNMIPGAFAVGYEDNSLYSRNEDVARGIVDDGNGNLLAPPPVPYQTRNVDYVPEERHNEVTAAFEQFQRQEQAQFRRPRDHFAGSNTAVPVPSYEQPAYARQLSPTVYQRHASNRYRPSGRSGRTSNLRHELLNYEEDPPSYPAFRNQGSSTYFTPDETIGYLALDPFQQPRHQARQQSRWGQNSEYQGAYGNRNYGEANSTTAFQHSPFLPPGQEPHDVNDPPPVFQTRSSASQSVHTIPSTRQGYPATENAVYHQPQSTSIRTEIVSTSHNLSDAAEESEEEPREPTNKKKKGPPTHKPATLKKTMLKQGETKVVNGQLMWSDPNEPEDQRWKPAVVMDDIRKYILQQQNRVAQALGCSYLYPDEAGGDPYGDTAFFFPHRHLGEARDARPDILFAIDETETNNPQPSYDPGFMMYDPVTREIRDSGTLIVLNPADNPIVNWKEIPLCISPHMDGFKIEYMRRVNKAIRQRDIWSRMPRWYWQKPGDPQSRRQISTENTMVNMPSKRFRQKAGCLTWTDRGGSDVLEMGLKELLNRTVVGRQCIAANSMRGFGRDLNGVEKIQVQRGNANGKYLNKAGSRAIDEQTRNARIAKEDERIAKAQRDGKLPMPLPSALPLPAILPGTRAGSQPGESRKRDRSNDEENSEVSEIEASVQQRPQKRVRTARKGPSRFSEDDDLAMFDQQQLVIEDADAAQRYQLRASAREEVLHEEDGEEASNDSLFGDGEEDVDEELPGSGSESEDDDDPYMPDETPVPTTDTPSIHNDDEEEEDEHHKQEGNVNDEHRKPETATPYPVPEDPYHQPSSADNAKAGLSDLEGHRRWVREMCRVL